MNIKKAFIYGALLTDGCIKEHINRKLWKNWQIQIDSIDKEFLEKIQKYWSEIYGKSGSICENYPAGQYLIRGKTGKRKQMWRWTAYGNKIAEEILAETKNKTEIPDWIKNGDLEVRKSFIGSAIDGDGYISTWIGRKGQTLCFSGGFSGSKPFIEQMKDIMTKSGIQCYKLRKYWDAECFRFTFNVVDLIKANIELTIKRKQQKIEKIRGILRDYMLGDSKLRRYSEGFEAMI